MSKPLGPPYKGTNNSWLTASIFWSRQDSALYANQFRGNETIFSLYSDKPDHINCRKTFVSLEDPTGYKWALEYLGDWEHWQALMKCKWFAKAYEAWCEELTIKLKAEAMGIIASEMRNGDSKSRIPAARYLADDAFNKISPRKAGAPTKTEVSAEMKKALRELAVQKDDAERIGLVQPLKVVS